MNKQEYFLNKNKGKRLTSSAPNVKLNVQHIPTKGEKISEGLKKHHANRKRVKAMTNRHASKLAQKWGAKYNVEEGK